MHCTPGPQTANLKRKPETLWNLPTDVLSAASPQYQYKKNYEKSKGHYHTIPDNLEQLHLKEATELQSIVSSSRCLAHSQCPFARSINNQHQVHSRKDAFNRLYLRKGSLVLGL